MIPQTINYGDTIGLIAPCHVADRARYAGILRGQRAAGFIVKEGKNLYKNTYGYAASEDERLNDFHAMFLDDEVKMIFFGGGNSGNEFLPLIDYDLVKTHPKIVCSYSNGTSLLLAIYANTGFTTFYGQSPGMFDALTDYDFAHFTDHFISGSPSSFRQFSPWQTLCGGTGEGVLIGGFTSLIAQLMGNRSITLKEDKYILFLENRDVYSSVAAVACDLAAIEQSGLMERVTGVLFGNYADAENPELLGCLLRFGERHGIPMVKCDDFGHGARHGILPIGRRARLDAEKGELFYL